MSIAAATNARPGSHAENGLPTSVDHLRALEAESVHIMREVVAEFERPVMLYSIGDRKSVV